MADTRQWTDAQIDSFVITVERAINPRAFVVCTMVFASLMMLGSEIIKSLIFCVGLHISMGLSLGKRHIERLAFVLFIVSSIYWIDIGSVQQWSALVSKKLVVMLT